MTPRAFFEEHLPELARARAALFPALAGTISIVVEHEAWTLRLHDAAVPVSKGGSPGADLALYFGADAFAALAGGTLDLDRAVERRAIGYAGDLRLLEQLGRLLQGGGSAHGVRSTP
ncbi:MAG: SCP2 sterol-binding domain-containing protein [Deltaproteobacteria bacterium]|nr:SCP2 sterol-binding domain-containing protein [Deltaproteobacteria bacterium]